MSEITKNKKQILWKIKIIQKIPLFKINLLILISLMDMIHLIKMINKKWKTMSQKLSLFYLWAIGFKQKFLNQILCKLY